MKGAHGYYRSEFLVAWKIGGWEKFFLDVPCSEVGSGACSPEGGADITTWAYSAGRVNPDQVEVLVLLCVHHDTPEECVCGGRCTPETHQDA